METRSSISVCDALRVAGIEVWFDQSELRGGDAWDQKIRQQIRDCVLFVPIISAATATRHEGYFPAQTVPLRVLFLEVDFGT